MVFTVSPLVCIEFMVLLIALKQKKSSDGYARILLDMYACMSAIKKEKNLGKKLLEISCN